MKKSKMIIWGTGGGAAIAFETLKNDNDIIAFADNSQATWGGVFCGKPVLSPNEVVGSAFDVIFIAVGPNVIKEIYEQLTNELKIASEKIRFNESIDTTDPRVETFQYIAQELNRKNIRGSIAELGVYRGDLAKHLNVFFSDRKLHLFDTFEGFDKKDIVIEKQLFMDEYLTDDIGRNNITNLVANKHLSNTSIELVLSKMSYPENVIIHKGYFPETTKNVSPNECFSFVNIDVDLYLPALKALKYFYERMTIGGIIFLHDYFLGQYKGIKHAFDEFLNENCDIKYIPLISIDSIAIIK